MEQQYIYWKTGTGCLIFIAGLVVATCAAIGLIPWFGLELVAVVWLGVCIPFILLSFRADRRIFERRRV